MATCKDNCIHYDVCKKHYNEENSALPDLFDLWLKPEICSDFKNKANFVELPCKVGDVVYLIPTYNGKAYCGVVEDKVQMIGVTSRGIHIKARNHHDHNKMYMLGKTVFPTKEEAEQVLKGGEDNGSNT